MDRERGWIAGRTGADGGFFGAMYSGGSCCWLPEAFSDQLEAVFRRQNCGKTKGSPDRPLQEGIEHGWELRWGLLGRREEDMKANGNVEKKIISFFSLTFSAALARGGAALGVSQ